VQLSFFRRRLHKHGHLAPVNQSKILSLSYCRGFLFFSYDGSSVISFDDTGDRLMSRFWSTVTGNASQRIKTNLLATSEPYGTVAQHPTQDLFHISVSAQILLVGIIDGNDICVQRSVTVPFDDNNGEGVDLVLTTLEPL
jgi:hypothetical protein